MFVSSLLCIRSPDVTILTRTAPLGCLQNIDGINFLFIKKNNIYFVVTTKFNVSPSFIIEVLERIAKVFKDYCGVLSEESIRKNFILLYELLDEMIVSMTAMENASLCVVAAPVRPMSHRRARNECTQS